MKLVIFMLIGYFCGSIPFGKLISWYYNIDIQKRGSGNIGFANVLRILGWRAGALTLIGDVAKGAAPVFLAKHSLGSTDAFWVGVIAIAGHVLPVWLRFKGGKGIATGLGVLLVLQPLAACIGLAIYVACYYLFHNSGISSLIGTVVIVILGFVMSRTNGLHDGLLLLIALWTHRKNITGKLPNYDL